MELEKINDILPYVKGKGDELLFKSEKLPMAVFPGIITRDKINHLYINRGESDILTVNEVEQLRLSAIELNILEKFVDEQKVLFAVVGDIGVGKSTILNYLRYNLPVCDSCYLSEACHSKKIGFKFNFDKDIYENVIDIETAKKVLYNDIAELVNTMINLYVKPSEKERLVDFWDDSIIKMKEDEWEGLSPSAFTRIYGALTDLSKLEGEICYDLADRRDIENSIKTEAHLYFNYTMKYWEYLILSKYKLTYCCYILFDNLDAIDIKYQYALLSILTSLEGIKSSLFIVCIREETLSMFGDKFTQLLDIIRIEEEDVLRPSDLLISSIDKFINRRDIYKKELKLKGSEFDKSIKFLKDLDAIFKRETGRLFINYFDLLCGDNLRVAVPVAQRLFKMTKKEADKIFKEGVIRELNRVITRYGLRRYEGKISNKINNMFEVESVGYGRYLAKPRILNYIYNKGGKGINIRDIQTHCDLFEYPEKLVRKALNEMLNKQRQLLVSNGYNRYESDDIYLRAFNDDLRITKLGVNYITTLIYTIDYLQETMFDCRVSRDLINIHKFNESEELTGKLYVLRVLLNDIYKADKYETDILKKKNKLNICREHYGGNMISFNVIYQISVATINICEYELRKLGKVINTDQKNEIIELIKSYCNLIVISAETNQQYLKVWPTGVDQYQRKVTKMEEAYDGRSGK